MIIGIAILLLGILYLLEIFNPTFVIDFSIVWPILLLIITIYYMLKDKKFSIGIALLLFIGLWSLLVNLDLIMYPYRKAFWPIILIIIGAFIIVAAIDGKNMNKSIRNSKHKEQRKKYVGILSSIEEKLKTDDFKGAEVYCIFGGVDLDLRQVHLKEDVILNVYSIFGGGTILVSDNYNLVCNSTALFGGNDNKADVADKKGVKTLTINCISFCGGTDIKS